MSNPTLRVQMKIKADVATVYKALTTSSALIVWLAESAEVNLADNRFSFWGKYTPDNPNQDSQHMKLLQYEENRLLEFQWVIDDISATVKFKLRERDNNTTVLTLIHEQALQTTHHSYSFTLEDFWFVHLENLRRYIDGKPSEARVDFSQPMNGNIRHILDSSATPEEVYAVLTQPDLIERWIASKAKVEVEKGADYDIGWGMEGLKIVEFDEAKKFSISWDEGLEDLTTVTWELEASGGRTHITFTHSGFDDDHKNDGIWAGWLNFLNWMRSTAEYGADWQPAAIILEGHEWAHIYPKSMHDAQANLDLSELVVSSS